MSELNTNPIADLNRYNLSMSKSLIDKIFFMDKIDDTIKVIVDYGCADGALIRFLAPLFPEMTFIGYDKNEDMISRAAKVNAYENCVFYSHPMNFLAWLQAHHALLMNVLSTCLLSFTKYIVIAQRMKLRIFGISSILWASNTSSFVICAQMKTLTVLL